MRRALLIPIARVAAITFATGGIFFVGTATAQAHVNNEIATAAAMAPIHSAIESLAPGVASARADMKLANETLDASKGKVLSESHRVALAASVAQSSKTIADASADTKAATLILTGDGKAPSTAKATKSLREARIDLQSIHKSTPSLIKQVAADVATWKAEQRRKADEVAEKAAEENARQDALRAAAAAAAARVTSVGRYSPISSASSTPPTSSAQAAAAPAAAVPVADKQSICQGVMGRFGFGNVVYNSGASQGHYGATDLDNQVIYIQLTLIPTERVASVCIHEYMHILQARQYGGYAQTVAHFGSVLGMERNADAMARANGATWTNY